MLAILLQVVTVFIIATAPGGTDVLINVQEISSIRHPTEEGAGQWQKDVECVILMTNGKAIGVTQTCREIIKRMTEQLPEEKK